MATDESTGFLREAKTYFSATPPKLTNSYSDKDGIAFSDDYSLVSSLIDSHPGVCIAEGSHSDANSKRVLIDNMADIARKGVTTIYMEHLFPEHQADLDQYFDDWSENPVLPPKLRKRLAELDEGHRLHDPQYSFTRLVESAKKHRVRIIASDHQKVYNVGEGSFSSDNKDREIMLNHYMVQHIQNHQQKKPGKYLVFVGAAHVGPEVGENEYINGVDELLGIPSVAFHSHRKVKQARLTIPTNFSYSYLRSNYIIERLNPPENPEEELFGITNTSGQRVLATRLATAIHLTGKRVHSLKNQDGLSPAMLAAAFGKYDLVEALLDSENPNEDELQALLTYAQKTNNSPLKQYLTEVKGKPTIVIEFQRGNLDSFPNFLNRLQQNENIGEHLILLGSLWNCHVEDLLRVLPKNQHIKKLTIKKDSIIDPISYYELLSRFIKETRGYIKIVDLDGNDELGIILRRITCRSFPQGTETRQWLLHKIAKANELYSPDKEQHYDAILELINECKTTPQAWRQLAVADYAKWRLTSKDSPASLGDINLYFSCGSSPQTTCSHSISLNDNHYPSPQGDSLQVYILSEIKEALEYCVNLEALDKLIMAFNASHEYTLLKKQDKTIKFFPPNTDSLKAYENMCKKKRDILRQEMVHPTYSESTLLLP